MDLKIISDNENPLFNRREIEGDIHAESSPSREEVTKIISDKFSVNPEVVKIRTIKGKFGEKVFLIVANIYKSKEDLDNTELKKKKDIEAFSKTKSQDSPAESIKQEKKTEQVQPKASEQTKDIPEPSGEVS